MSSSGFLALFLIAAGQSIAQLPGAGAIDDPTSDAVARFSCASVLSTGREDLRTIAAAYGQRSVALVRAGLADDQTKLGYMVAPEAQIVTHRGDMASGPKTTGPRAVSEWARGLRPKSFRYEIASTAPEPTDPCGDVRTTMILQGERDDQLINMELRYRGGLLVRALGREVRVETGRFAVPGQP
jgi:hypothetical protein